jgi:hypothetical protein
MVGARPNGDVRYSAYAVTAPKIENRDPYGSHVGVAAHDGNGVYNRGAKNWDLRRV